MKSLLRRLAVAVVAVGVTASAEATPMLQLDMDGGVYDSGSESVVAPGGAFTVFALLTPKENATQSQINALLADTYYISVALTPDVHSPSPLGSFEFGGTTYSATSNMTYGVPPLDAAMQGWDEKDLSKHGIFPTYFIEVGFKFSAANKTVTYNVQDNPDGLNPSSSGKSYYASFSGDSTLLASGYNLHFDLYTTKLAKCGTGCVDIDRDDFAPFSHDAETTTRRVPEPGSLLLLGLGIFATAAGTRRASSAA